MKLKATSMKSTSLTSNTIEYLFVISILDGCILDTLHPLSEIGDHTVYVNETEPYTI